MVVPQFEIVEALLTPGRGGRPGHKIVPRALVVHWTANTKAGANALANRNYFENHPEHKVSAHYVVDDHCVVRCVPESEVAYHVGARRYKAGIQALLGDYPNATTIGMEICVNADGDFGRTYQNAVALAGWIMRRYGWGVDRLFRHFDITGKNCPAFFVDDRWAKRFGFASAREGWERFRQHVVEAIQAQEVISLFKDIANHWAKADIEWLAKEGLVRGDEAGFFHPDRPLTRAEGSVLVRRAIDYVLRKVAERHGT